MPTHHESDDEALIAAAARWYVRILDGDLTAAERAALRAWLASPVHFRELALIATMDALVVMLEGPSRYH